MADRDRGGGGVVASGGGRERERIAREGGREGGRGGVVGWGFRRGVQTPIRPSNIVADYGPSMP